MGKYFPWRRVVAMTVSISTSVVSWAPTVNDWIAKLIPAFRDSNINWLAIISALAFFAFALWAIVDLCRKLESKPMLLIKSLGVIWLTDPTKQSFPCRMEYLYKVLIANSSSDKTLGIIDIRLQLKYKNRPKYIPPYIGIPESDSKNAEEGEIPGYMTLSPNESREGTIAFVEERNGNEEILGDRHPILNANIIVKDTQKKEYIFPATIEKMVEDQSFKGDNVKAKSNQT